VRDLVRSADELRMIRGLVGYASSLAALGAAPGLGAALARTVPGVPSYLERKGEEYADIVARKRRQQVEGAQGWHTEASDPFAGRLRESRSITPESADQQFPLDPGGHPEKRS